MYDESEPTPEDYGFEDEDEYGDGAWMDAYIASLPSEALEKALLASGAVTPVATQTQQMHTSSQSQSAEPQMDDVMMG